MASILGLDVGVNTPQIGISGFLADSWIYIFIIAFIGIILIVGIAALLFMTTYKKKVVIFENISGRAYQPVLKTRARVIKLGLGGEEILKTLKGGQFLSAYARKMGRNTFWFAKGSDGYLYNFLLGDLDAKLAILDIEPVDRDVRMFHVGISKLADQTYAKKNFLEKYGIHMMLFLFLIIMLVGFFLIAGQIKEGLIASNNPETAKINQETIELTNSILTKIDSIQRGGESGLKPATETGSGIVPTE